MLPFINVGKPVALYTASIGSVRILTVERVTAGGQVVLRDWHHRYRADTGRQVGNHYSGTELRSVTDPDVINARAFSLMVRLQQHHGRVANRMTDRSVSAVRTALSALITDATNALKVIDGIERGDVQ